MRSSRWTYHKSQKPGVGRTTRRTALILLLLLIAAGAAAMSLAFRSLVTELAVSSARDVVVTSINSIVKEIMTDPDFDAAELVRLEKGTDGAVTAVTTNVAEVNILAARVLERAVAQTAEKTVSVDIRLGNLTGSALLLGKGPHIPVQIVMLSSSVAGFRSELTTAGINQTRHQILLDLAVDVSLLMPWRTVSTKVDTEILVSETVIVGAVPESYLNLEN